MTAKSTSVIPQPTPVVKGTGPAIPRIASRLRIDDDGNFIDDTGNVVDERFSAKRRAFPIGAEIFEALIEQMYARFREELADYVQQASSNINTDYLYCAICSHDGCAHHHANEPYNREAIEAFMPTTSSTIYSWLHDKRMPAPISGPPYEWDPHAIACFKYDDKLVFQNGHYDRDEHLRLLEVVREEREAKRAAKSRKLSAHMVRENARRRRATGAKKSTDSRQTSRRTRKA